MSKYFIFKKGDNIKLSEHFNSSEFECKCNDKTHDNLISKELIEKLELVRQEMGMPMKIHSGYRSPEHNVTIGGAPKSQHVLGNAADVSCVDMNKLLLVLEKHFKAIGLGQKKGFLHVDTRMDKDRRWDY